MAAEDNVEKKSDGKGGLKSFIAGGCGGICVVLSGHPFDTIKVSENSFKRETFLFFEKGKHSGSQSFLRFDIFVCGDL